VVVVDTTAPLLTVPATQTAEATSAAGALVGYPAASATDAVGPVTITYSQASGSLFGLGTTHVTVTATDGAGNASTGSFDVVVRDTVAPLLSVPATQTAEATSAAGALVSYPAAERHGCGRPRDDHVLAGVGLAVPARHDARDRDGDGCGGQRVEPAASTSSSATPLRRSLGAGNADGRGDERGRRARELSGSECDRRGSAP